MKGPKPRPIYERFIEKAIIASSGCWEWQAATHDGYGMFGMSRVQMIGAHRASWILHHGFIPKGKHVLHKCDNKPCVNPDHLELGTHRKNMKDAWKRGLVVMAPKKLTQERADQIREEAGKLREIALRNNISESMVSLIKNGKAWKRLKKRAA